ncbi:MAG: hypothetical protein F6K55_03340 [Moorea sp. SIO4A3]|nr:hypothetical protein [Moorena sp. SIO4A3]
MTKISGKINGGVTGVLVVTPDMPFISTDNSLVIKPVEIKISNGSIVDDAQVVQSEKTEKGKGVTYHWEIFEIEKIIEYYFLTGEFYTTERADQDGVLKSLKPTHKEGNKYFTGSTHDESQRALDRTEKEIQVLLQSFHAICPAPKKGEENTPVDIADLIGINQQQPYLDISLMRLAELLTLTPEYTERLRLKLNFKDSPYSASQNYTFGDVVFNKGSSYVYRNTVDSTGKPLTDTEYWMPIAHKGEPGRDGAAGGVEAPDDDYGTSWKTSTRAATQKAIYGEIEPIREVVAEHNDAIAGNKQVIESTRIFLQNPEFTSSIKRLRPVSVDSDDNELATVAFVKQQVAIPAIEPLPQPVIHYTHTFTHGLSRRIPSTIPWDGKSIGSNYYSAGGIVAPENGSYLFFCSLMFTLDGISSSASQSSIVQCYIELSNGDKLFFFNTIDSSFGEKIRVQRQGWQYWDLTQGEKIQVKALISGSGIRGGNIAPESGNGNMNNFLVIWKVRGAA